MNPHLHIQKAIASVSLLTRRQRVIGILIAIGFVGGTFAGIRSWASVISDPPETIEEPVVLFSATPRQPTEVEPIVITPSVYSDTAHQRRAARVVLHAAATEPVTNQEAPVESTGLRSLLRWIGMLGDGRDGEVLTMVNGKPQWLSPHAPNTTTARPETTRTSNGDIVERESGSRRGGGGGGSSVTETTVTQNITQIIDSAEWILTGTGVTLSDDDHYVGIGTSTPRAKLEVAGTISGASIAVSQNATINGSLWVLGTVSGATLGGFGLTDCDASSQLLQWDDTTDRFVCGTAITTGTGNILAVTDPRFVNTGGDTMTGAFVIQNGNTHAPTASPLLNVRGTISGALLTLNSAGTNYITNGSLSLGKTTSKATLDVVGTISGSALQINGNASIGTSTSNGRLTLRAPANDTYAWVVLDNDTTNIRAGLYINGPTHPPQFRMFDDSNVQQTSLYTSGDNCLLCNNPTLGNVSIGKATGKAKFEVLGTISGSLITQNGAGNNSFKGNVGIGTTTPNIGLEVVGKVAIGDSVTSALLASGNGPRVLNLIDTNAIIRNWRRTTDNGQYSGVELIWGTNANAADPANKWWNVELNGGDKLGFARRTGSGNPSFKMSIDDSGSVLIKDGLSLTTDTAKAKLDVVGTISGSLITQNGAGNNYFMGNVGIGTPSPARKLVIDAAAGSNANFSLEDDDVSHGMTYLGINSNTHFDIGPWGGNDGGAALLGVSDVGNVPSLAFIGVKGASSTTVPAIVFAGAKKNGTGVQALGADEPLAQWRNEVGGTGLMTIMGSGNLGIGTTTPQSLMDVWDGDVLLSDTSAAHGTTSYAPTNAYGRFSIVDAGLGGLNVWGISESNTTPGLGLRGIVNGDPTSAFNAAFFLQGFKKSGVGGTTIGATGKVLELVNFNVNLLTVLGNGNTGIGVVAPKTKLDVVGTISGSALTVSNLQSCDTTDTDAKGVFACGTDNTSDERLKTNVTPLQDGALAFLTSVRTVTYDWNEQMLALHPNAADDGTQVGFIAQDFENLYPELVRKDSNGFLGINYSHVTPLIVQGLKELNTKVDSLSGSGSTESAIDLGPIETGLASLTDRLALLEANVRSLSGSTTVLDPSMPSSASDLAASTLALDQTLSVGTDARIAGNLHLDGSLYLTDLLLPGILSADAVIANTLSVTSDSIIHGSLTLDGPLVLGSGAMLQFGSGLTLNDLIVENSLSVLGAITVHGMADFLGDVAIAGELRVSSRQAGNAVIERGETSATISFIPPLTRTPVVTATPQDFVTVAWRVTAKSATGFIIQLAAPEASALRFDWTATVTTDDLVESTVMEEGTVFPLDSRGVPVSSSLQWNACLRGIPIFDATGQPYSCSRYHNLNSWEHPDLGISFIWNDSVTPPYLKLPDGYTATVTEDAATIAAAIAAVNAEQSSGEPTETPPESTESSSSESLASSSASSSSESSVSSDTSAAVESPSSSSESSAESLASSSEASVSSEAILTPGELVETPPEEPLMTPVEPKPAPPVTEPAE